MAFSDIIHYNRDENSFTARLFEYTLFPMWASNPGTFIKFLNILIHASKQNRNQITDKYPHANIKAFHLPNPINFTFKEGMLFLEALDIYGYCKNNNISLSKSPDKTEFDCVIVCEETTNDSSKKEHIIVFEVKCYTDLLASEIERQNDWLEEYKKAGLFNEYHHFALISKSNQNNARDTFNNPVNFSKCRNGLYIVNWGDFANYLTAPRFANGIDTNLYKNVSYTGVYTTPRTLI